MTDVGAVREVNEDALLSRVPWFAVADGLGGHHGGEVASSIVVEEVAALASTGSEDADADTTDASIPEGGGWDTERAARAILTALATSQDRIHAYSEERRSDPADLWYAGTTAVVAALVDSDEHGPSWLVANLGDSRAYRFGDGMLQQVSVDHSLVQQLVDAGRITPMEALVHPERNVVTKALGGPEPPDPDFYLLPLRVTPRLLLCTDGITTMLSDHQIAALLTEEPEAGAAAARLVSEAVAAGGYDNATAIVVDVLGGLPEGDPSPPEMSETQGRPAT